MNASRRKFTKIFKKRRSDFETARLRAGGSLHTFMREFVTFVSKAVALSWTKKIIE